MKVQAKPNETVNTLLYRVFGSDSDQLEEEFYRLNPKQGTPFLDPYQMVEVPNHRTESQQINEPDEIEVWS